MKPEQWQIRESLENLLRNPENRYIFKMPLDEILNATGLIMIDDTVKMLDKYEPIKAHKRKKKGGKRKCVTVKSHVRGKNK